MSRFIDTRPPLSHWLVACLFLLVAALPASAQLVVYEMDFKRTEGFNDNPFVEGYLVAPVVGGDASFVVVQNSSAGRRVLPFNTAGRLFRGVTEHREAVWVGQAQIGGGTTTTPGNDDGGGTTSTGASPGAMVATGKANRSVSIKTGLVTFSVRIASQLKGRLISGASDDLPLLTSPRVGYVTFADWTLDFDSRQTDIVNANDYDLAAATNYLEDLLTGDEDGGGGTPIDRTLLITGPSSLPDGLVGTAYSVQFNGAGGVGGRAWSLAAGTLPPGLTLSASGLLSGTPTSATGSPFSLTIRLSDSTGSAVTRNYTLVVVPQLTVREDPLPPGTIGDGYPVPFLTANGAQGAVTWTLLSGSLPPGLTLETNGQIIGTPTGPAGTYNFVVRATDSVSGQIDDGSFSIVIQAP